MVRSLTSGLQASKVSAGGLGYWEGFQCKVLVLVVVSG